MKNKPMSFLFHSLGLSLIAVFISACGGSSATNFGAYFTGTITGSINNTATSGTFSMTTHQTGSTVYGDWFVTSPASSGTMNGTVNGSTMTGNFTPVSGALPTTVFIGTFTLNGSQSSVTFSGGTTTTNATSTLTLTQ